MNWNIKPGRYSLVYWLFAIVMLIWTTIAIWVEVPVALKVFITIFLVISTLCAALMTYVGIAEYFEEQDEIANAEYLLEREKQLDDWLETWLNNEGKD